MMRYFITIILTILIVLSMIYHTMMPHLTTWIFSDYTVTPQHFQQADVGNPEALTKIGDMYYASQKYTQAVSFYAQASDKDYAPATLKLAAMYKNGIGVPKDEIRANELLLKSSMKGDINALKGLGNNLKDALGL
ncbi:MAG: TPR repeat protein [Alphaproteobacteria bacterium]|jgi:TPR repeat protein